ncbi:MAG TPA: adenylate/guanylate cyclase domain-containing protein [Egibacteraceae bacterium]|nr:adenylate/guanylate cyclase domain-containing protein [Egibacteraceae bacterium]
MTGVLVHLVVYAAVNGLLLGIWYLAGAATPFWPVWVLAPWGAGLAIHAGVVAVTAPARMRRRRRRRRAAAASAGRTWIAAMFTDLVGSSALAERLGDEAWARLIGSYRRTVETVAAAHGGAVIGTQGDGVLLRFDSPAKALRAAAALQRQFARRRDDGDALPPVRVGIHAGEAVAVGGDVLGQMVNVAARIADAAGADEVLVSEPVADHAPPEMAFDDRGLQSVKGSDKARHILALRWRGVE